MNWKRYFELVDKKKSWFLKIFLLFVFTHLILFGGKLFQGVHGICPNICSNETPYYRQQSIQRYFTDYVWYDCGPYCSAFPESYVTSLNKERIFFGPFIFLIYLFVAYFLSFLLFVYKIKKEEINQDEKADQVDSKGGTKREKKGEKSKE